MHRLEFVSIWLGVNAHDPIHVHGSSLGQLGRLQKLPTAAKLNCSEGSAARKALFFIGGKGVFGKLLDPGQTATRTEKSRL
jgi:hypothetical protein